MKSRSGAPKRSWNDHDSSFEEGSEGDVGSSTFAWPASDEELEAARSFLKEW